MVACVVAPVVTRMGVGTNDIAASDPFEFYAKGGLMVCLGGAE